MTGLDHCGALLAAHGERGGGADNSSVERLAAGLSRQGLEVHFGFIKGTPTIAEAMRACTAPRLLVYPLFLADGFFTHIRLPQLIAEAGPPHSGRVIEILPPLGLDPGLASLVATKASEAARTGGCPEHQVTIVLLAHGSTNDAASHRAADALARELRAPNRFRAVACAFLEEPPALKDAVARAPGPIVVVGLFAGEGLHGHEDVARLMAGLRRRDIAFAGNVGTWPEIVDIVAAAIGNQRLTAQIDRAPPR